MKDLWLILFGIAMLVFLVWFGYMSGHTQGFCDALGGAPLNGAACNVDGKVVVIP